MILRSTIASSMLGFILLAAYISFVQASEICPRGPAGAQITCAFKCCESLEGANHGYYCCDPDDRKVVREGAEQTRPERFVAYGSTFQVDYSLLLIGLILSVIISVILSLLCCLLCNGCWLHRRRNPHMYETVNDSGWYPICCGFGIPLGTVVFSTHPPQFRDDGIYHHSSTSSVPVSSSGQSRVRFNEDGTPKGVLKNGGTHHDY